MFQDMASKLRKFNKNSNIDNVLDTEDDCEGELSLADDVDEMSINIAGKLTIIPDETSENANEQVPKSFLDEHSNVVSKHSKVSFEICNAGVVKNGLSKHVLYSIIIVRGCGSDSSSVIVEKRYSEFSELNANLNKRYPSIMTNISFPPKLVTGNFRPENIALRSRSFEQYLSHLYSIEVLRLSPDFASFFYKQSLSETHNLLASSEFSSALPKLKNIMHIQQSLLGDGHEAVIATQCALVAAASQTGQTLLAQGFADLALNNIGRDDHNHFLPALLVLAIRLCWKLGKDKSDLESRLVALRARGIDVDKTEPLISLILASR